MAAAGGGGGAAGPGAACAACKYQRRRCTADCPLAQFFPHDRPHVFRSAHRLFGVSNILKTLARAGPERRREAMECIIYESQVWDANPTSGCVPIILNLQNRIRQAELQLRDTCDAIRAYRAAAAAQESSPDSSLAPFGFQPGDRGVVPPFMYPTDQHQQPVVLPNGASDHDGAATTAAASVATPLQAPPWMTMEPPQYDMMASSSNLDMAAGVVPIVQLIDDATMVPQTEHVPIKPDPSFDEMSYFVDNIDEENEMPHQSCTDSSSDKKAMETLRVEDANGFELDAAACRFTLTGAKY